MNIPLLVGLALALFSLYMLFHAVNRYKRAIASLQWPSTEGHLEHCKLWGKRNIDGEMKDTEKLSVNYTYEIDGTFYKGDTIAFYTLMYPKTVELAQDFSTKTNKSITVFYNSEDASESVLIPGLNPVKPKSDIFLAMFGIVIGIIVAFLA